MAYQGRLMNVLGINYIFHDTAACIVSNGDLVVAIEEERLSRKKHSQEFPQAAINACLRYAKLHTNDVDHIAISVQPGKMISDKLSYAARLNGSSTSFISYEFDRLQARHLTFWSWFHRTWPSEGRCPKVHFIDHHAAHAEGSYFISPWRKAALGSIDGWGEWTTTWLGFADGFVIHRVNESVFPHSLGLFYSAATEFCGFKPNYDEGKTMGLAPTGESGHYYRDVNSMVEIGPLGQLQVDMSWFDYGALDGGLCSQKFYSRFGSPRTKTEPIAKNHRDIAAAFQRVLEEKALALCRVLEQSTDAENIVLAGGVALNSVMNGRILRETRFKDVYVMPGAGDNGTCIGAAYQLLNGKLRQEKHYIHDNPYLGIEYSNGEIKTFLDECKISYRHSNDVCSEAANLLAVGKIVGWFQGRMEFGARALGNRSILADPSILGMKDRVNADVKHREPFRPFAPSIPAERRNSYFDIDVDSPFMLKVCAVRPERRDAVPAIVHVDGSARLQTVERAINPRYHELLTKFGEITGHPVLLNTSFNIMDEPIVESPLHAIRCFFSTGLDSLVMGDYVVSK
jgi:carbamoyltransferase